MSKDRPDHSGRRGCTRVWSSSMTNITRSDLALGNMAGETCRVCGDRRGDRLRRSGGCVTRNAALWRESLAPCVCRVVELHIKAFVEPRGKRLHRRRDRLRIAVTGGANVRLRIREFAHVTPDARIVSGVFQFERPALALVTRVAVDLVVCFDGMQERSEILIGIGDSRGGGRLGIHRRDRYVRPTRFVQTARRENNKRKHRDR